MKITLIRHGMTQGNKDAKYLGITDLSLIPEGISALEELKQQGVYPAIDRLISSPMLRCLESCGVIYPNQTPIIESKLQEMDFGNFENNSYEELKNRKNFQLWLDSGGKGEYSGGEGIEHFAQRCKEGFLAQLLGVKEEEQLGFLVHGGVIMTILGAFSYPQENFYHWQVDNGKGYTFQFNINKQRASEIQPLVKE